MNRKIKIKSKQTLFDDIFQIEEAYLQYELPDGSMTSLMRRLNFERGDSAAAIVINKDIQKCIFVRQFRYPASKKETGWVIEVPAGIVEDSESPETCIRREILEEIGYKTNQLIPVFTFFTSPGGSSERIILYCAVVGVEDKVNAGGGVVEEEENIEIIEIPLHHIENILHSNIIFDSKTIIAIQWLQRELIEKKLFGELDYA